MVNTVRQLAARGFTLLELLIAMLILAIMVSLTQVTFGFAIDTANNHKAIADVATIGAKIIHFQVNNERMPVSLAELDGIADEDPWGNAYRYLSFENGVNRAAARKNRNLVPINMLFDLYSMGKDGASLSPLTASQSQDDIVCANDGSFIGLAEDY